MIINLFFCLILIIIIFYLLDKAIKNKIYDKNQVKENFLTYFLPFYDTNITSLTNFYANNENKENFFKKKFNYDQINFGCVKDDILFIRFFLNHFIAESMNTKAQYIVYKYNQVILSNLIQDKISFALTTIPIINYYAEDEKNNISSLNIISNLYKMYIYIFTLKVYNVFNIKQIPAGFIIGILGNPDSFFLYYKKFLRDLGYNEGDLKIKTYNSADELFDALVNNQCNMIIICDIFPSKKISNNLDKNVGSFIILLPFEMYNEELFFKKNIFAKKGFIDLNLLSPSYLPKTFGKYNYNHFKPTIAIPYIYKVMICNRSTNYLYTYSFIKFLYENYKQINKNLIDRGYALDVKPTKNQLEYHKGVIKYMKEKGYLSFEDNLNCASLVGVMECNEENLKNNNLHLN